MSVDFGERARALVGTPFRLQGRDTQGIDCVGVIAATFELPADGIPRNYRLRGNVPARMREALDLYFRRIPDAQLRAGDLMLMQVSADQLHLGVRTAAGFVHAHARLRRVVETPGDPQWPVIGVYRRRRA